MKLCTRFERNRTISGGVIAISVFDLMTLNIAWHDALGSGIIFSKVDIRQLICSWTIALSDADTLCHAVTLTFDLLTLNVRDTLSVMWSKSVRNLSEIEQSAAELLQFQCLTALWHWTLRYVWRSALRYFSLIKFDLRQLIRAWIIASLNTDTLCHGVTLRFDRWPWTFVVQ